MAKIKLIEIARSYSYKRVTNLGNFSSETVDNFCSQKAECEEKDAEKTSEALYQFCKNEVVKSINADKKTVNGDGYPHGNNGVLPPSTKSNSDEIIAMLEKRRINNEKQFTIIGINPDGSLIKKEVNKEEDASEPY